MLDQPAPPAIDLTPRVTDRIPRARPLLLVGILAWLVPGLGHVVMGRARKGVVMLVAVGGLFGAGLLLTSFTCVDPQRYTLEFVAQIFAGGPTLGALYVSDGQPAQELLPHFDVGRLYVDVAGLLNVVAISDALGLALAHNARVVALRQLAWERAQPAPEEVDLAPVADAEPTPSTAPDVTPAAPDVFPAFGWRPPESEEEQT